MSTAPYKDKVSVRTLSTFSSFTICIYYTHEVNKKINREKYKYSRTSPYRHLSNVDSFLRTNKILIHFL